MDRMYCHSCTYTGEVEEFETPPNPYISYDTCTIACPHCGSDLVNYLDRPTNEEKTK